MITVEVEDLINHSSEELQLSGSGDIEEVLGHIGYKDVELYHMVNGRHVPRDFKLKNGDEVAIILALGGG